MVAGWSVAARLQPLPVNQVAEPVSALAAVGAADRWVMSLTFVVVGGCAFVTGLALRPARVPGRLILMTGAVAGMLVAANPEYPGTRFPVAHMICAAAGCGGVAARAFGAVGAAAGGVGWRRRAITGSGGLVRHGADHRRRAGWPGGTYLRVGASAVAARGGRILPSQPVLAPENEIEHERGDDDRDDRYGESDRFAETGIGHVHSVVSGNERRDRDYCGPACDLLRDDIQPVAL